MLKMFTTLLLIAFLSLGSTSVTLFDSTPEPTGTDISSSYDYFTTAFSGTDKRIAADFLAEADWQISTVKALGFYSQPGSKVGIFTWNLFIYDSSGSGDRPGAIYAQRIGISDFIDEVANEGDVTITVSPAIAIEAAGKYWIAIQAVAPVGTGLWWWQTSAVQTLNQWVYAENGASPSNFVDIPGPDGRFALLGEGTVPGSTPAYPCVSDCVGVVPFGNYQSCETCNGYVTCVHDLKYEMPCPATTVWDDVAKNCLGVSTTCAVEVTPAESSGCIKSCVGRSDGDYQSCRSCGVYVSCANGGIIDNRPCPVPLVWDDDAKGCRGSSTTCA